MNKLNSIFNIIKKFKYILITNIIIKKTRKINKIRKKCNIKKIKIINIKNKILKILLKKINININIKKGSKYIILLNNLKKTPNLIKKNIKKKKIKLIFIIRKGKKIKKNKFICLLINNRNFFLNTLIKTLSIQNKIFYLLKNINIKNENK
ncbi:MAG: hypothetical protein AAYR31_00020 [Candidatus Vidania fulgoroideorum]